MSAGYQQLEVWKRATELAVAVYRASMDGFLSKDFGLKDQMQRAAVSIASNIAEGDERESNKESVRYFYIARGSAAELQTQLIIAHRVGIIDPCTFQQLSDSCDHVGRMLFKLIQVRTRTKSQKPKSPMPSAF